MKIIGAMAEAGCWVEDCITIFEKVRGATRTISTAISGGTNPHTGIKLFELEEDKIEIGIGVHGGAGLRPSHAIIDNLLTTQESAGFSISMLKVTEDMYPYWFAHNDAPYFK